MSRVLAALIAGLLASAAYAQGAGTPGSVVPGNEKAAAAGDARQAQKAHGNVKKAGGDTMGTPGSTAAGNEKAAAAGEARRSTRDARKPGRAKTTQGGTPDGGQSVK